MPKPPIKILFFSDSHLGFDQPIRPRVTMRRRGPDFFANYHFLLDFAKKQKVDAIVHGGDMFFRSLVHPSIVEQAYQPLVEVANLGIPIYLVPGNHERAKLPNHLWLAHRNIHVFDQPKTFLQEFENGRIAFSGFPFAWKVRNKFQDLVAQSQSCKDKADIHFLCVHQAFEGAQVGPSNYTFRRGADNIPLEAIPRKFTAVLSGHIHRSQILTKTLDHQPAPTPVIYSGSIERTSFAERQEEKHFVLLEIDPEFRNPKPKIEFHPLPTRPMLKINVSTQDEDLKLIEKDIIRKLLALDPNAIVRVKLNGHNVEVVQNKLSAGRLRELAPKSMNISLAYDWANRGNAK